MLHSISWAVFSKAALLLTLLYYVIVAFLYYRKEIGAWLWRKRRTISVVQVLVAGAYSLHAQTADGNAGINQANTMVRSYYDTGVNLMYAVGALVAIIGAVHTFSIWNKGQRDEALRAGAAWFGSCVFLAVVATVIKSFFGL
jgi:Domain of unknown function (DUF4134)